jgi:hypothetical protein
MVSARRYVLSERRDGLDDRTNPGRRRRPGYRHAPGAGEFGATLTARDTANPLTARDTANPLTERDVSAAIAARYVAWMLAMQALGLFNVSRSLPLAAEYG